MILTEQQIEARIYTMIKGSELGSMIGGTVYRKGMRPTDAETEDIVVQFLTGTNGLHQMATVVVNVYIPQITMSDGRKVNNLSRIDELEAVAVQIPMTHGTEMGISIEDAPSITPIDDIHQTCLTIRLECLHVVQ